MRDDINKSAVNWNELDRLVDGRLDRDEYRALLDQLERHPEGWRQCAMAFLEHQALEIEMSKFRELDVVGVEPASQQKEEKQHSASVARTGWRGWLAMATCMLVGAVLGSSLQPGASPFQPVISTPANVASDAVAPNMRTMEAESAVDLAQSSVPESKPHYQESFYHNVVLPSSPGINLRDHAWGDDYPPMRGVSEASSELQIEGHEDLKNEIASRGY